MICLAAMQANMPPMLPRLGVVVSLTRLSIGTNPFRVMGLFQIVADSHV